MIQFIRENRLFCFVIAAYVVVFVSDQLTIARMLRNNAALIVLITESQQANWEAIATAQQCEDGLKKAIALLKARGIQ